jgi:hypothetical protein
LSAVRAYLQSLTGSAEGGSFTIEPSSIGHYYLYFCFFASTAHSGELCEQLVTIEQAHTAYYRPALLPFVMYGA